MVAHNYTVISDPFTPEVLIFGTSSFMAATVIERLINLGFRPAVVVPDASAAMAAISYTTPQTVILPSGGENSWRDFGYVLESLKKKKETGLIAVLTDSPSIEDLTAAFCNGIDDYFIARPQFDLAEEVERHISEGKVPSGVHWDTGIIKRMGLFRSIGLTVGQVDLLAQYAEDFPRHSELARRMGKAENQLRKAFSRIYEKMGPLLGVNSPARLAKLLTLCIKK